jgi:hypothetical protein
MPLGAGRDAIAFSLLSIPKGKSSSNVEIDIPASLSIPQFFSTLCRFVANTIGPLLDGVLGIVLKTGAKKQLATIAERSSSDPESSSS